MAYKTLPFHQLGKAGYNRGIDRKHVNEIKRDFHEDMVQPAIVSHRDGKYWIVDHQHQSQAIYELNNCDPNTPIRCDVRTGLTYEQEAELYYRLNTGSKALSFADKLVGLLESKDADALRFRDTVESCGYTVGGKRAGSLDSLQQAWMIFKRKNGGEATLAEILSLTHACWPNSKHGVHSHMIRGIDLFLCIHGDEYKKERFITALSECNPSELLDSASAHCKVAPKSHTKAYCVYLKLIEAYNNRLKHKLDVSGPIK